MFDRAEHTRTHRARSRSPWPDGDAHDRGERPGRPTRSVKHFAESEAVDRTSGIHGLTTDSRPPPRLQHTLGKHPP